MSAARSARAPPSADAGSRRPAAVLSLAWIAPPARPDGGRRRRVRLPVRQRPRRHRHAQHRDVGPVHPVLHVLRRPLGRRADRRLRGPAVRRHGVQADHPPGGAGGDGRGHARRPRSSSPTWAARSGSSTSCSTQPDLADDLGHHDRHRLHGDVGVLRLAVRAGRPRPARLAAGARDRDVGARRWPATSGSRRAMAWVALPAAILLHSITAWIFGLQISRGFWYTLDHGADVHRLGARVRASAS